MWSISTVPTLSFSMSLPFKRLAEISARKTAALFALAGSLNSYSKKPLPAPLTFRPSKMFHCFCDHLAFVKSFGATRMTPSFAAFSATVTNVVKLRAMIFAPFLTEKQIAPTAGTFGSWTLTVPISVCIHAVASMERATSLAGLSVNLPCSSHQRMTAVTESLRPAYLSVVREMNNGTGHLAPGSKLRQSSLSNARYASACKSLSDMPGKICSMPVYFAVRSKRT